MVNLTWTHILINGKHRYTATDGSWTSKTHVSHLAAVKEYTKYARKNTTTTGE